MRDKRLEYFSQDELYCLSEGLAAFLDEMDDRKRIRKLLAEKISGRLLSEIRGELRKLYDRNEESY